VKTFLKGEKAQTIRALFHESRLQTQGCIIFFALFVKIRDQEKDVARRFDPEKEWPDLFDNNTMTQYLHSIQSLVHGKEPSLRVLGISCVTLNEEMHHIYSWKEDLETKNLLGETLHDAIVQIQNALMDPLWTSFQKLLAVECLGDILFILDQEISKSIASLEWFQVLVEKAFTTMCDESADATINWTPWAVLLKSLANFISFDRPGFPTQPLSDSQENMEKLLEATFRNRQDPERLLTILDLWTHFLSIRKFPICQEKARKLKNFFVSVFNELPSSNCEFDGQNFQEISTINENCRENVVPQCILHSISQFITSRTRSTKSIGGISMSNRIVELMRLLDCRNQEGNTN
jgi:hypothetical protein